MRKILFLLGLCSIVVSAEAQKHPNIELGFKPERLYQFHDLDSVNLFNGNLLVTIPIGPAQNPDGSFTYRLTLVYNGKIWDYYRDGVHEHNLGADPNWRSNAGIGWRLSLGRLLGPSDGSNYYPSNESNRWLYEGASGAEHAFDNSPNDVMLSQDEAHLRLVRVENSPDMRVEFPNGDRHTFKKERGRWRLRQMIDRFGNALSVASDWVDDNDPFDGREAAWILTDSANRTHRVNFQSFAGHDRSVDRGQHVSSVVLASVAGDATYTFDVEEETAAWGCDHQPHADWDVPSQATLPLLKALTLPDGTSYQFDYYHSAHEGGPCSQGSLQSMTVPAGGTTTYEYGHITLPESFCRASTFGSRNPGIKARTTPDGRWDYVQSSSQSVPFDFPKAEDDCGVGTEHPDNPSPRCSRFSAGIA